MNFWETFRQAPIDPQKWWSRFRPAAVKEISRHFVTIPPFTVNNLDQTTASFIATEFRLNNTTPFSLSRHIRPPSNPQFCLGIRSPQNNSDGLYVQRYKLWHDVGEVLEFPNYEGQKINPSSAFEIWTLVPNAGSLELDEPLLIYLSYLATPSPNEYCCFGVDTEMALEQYCSLFALKNDSANYDVPIVFDHCLNDGITPPSEQDVGIITEDATGKITTEEQDPLITEDQP